MIFMRLLALLLLVCSCNSNGSRVSNRVVDVQHWREQNGKVKVLSTIAMIDDLVKQIGKEHVDALTLITGELDPHSYQLVKGDDEKFAFADLIFYNGLGLEHGPSLQHHLHTSPKAIALGNKIQKQFPELILYYHGQLDPHIWMDISLWAKSIPFIVEALSEKDPAHKDSYVTNGNKLLEEMLHTHDNAKQKMHEIPEEKRYLVTSHDAFNYFTRAYMALDSELQNNRWQKRFAAPEGLSPESQLSTTDIQMILDYVKKYDIQLLFPESNVSKDSIRKIISAAKDRGMELRMATPYLYGDAMGAPGSDGDTYLKMIQHDVLTIASCLIGVHPSIQPAESP